MSEIADKGKDVGEKAKALADAGIEKLKGVDWKAQGDKAKALADEGIEKLKNVDWKAQGNAAAEKAKAAKAKIQATWKSGTKGKVVCVIGVALILWIGSCIFSGGNDTDGAVSSVDYSRYEKLSGWEKIPKGVNMFVSLRNAASPRCKPSKGCSFVHLGFGLKIANYSVSDHGAVVEMSQDGMSAIGNLVAATSGDVGNINDPDDEGRLLYVDTVNEYSRGEQLEAGVYEYVGLETLENALGKEAVRAFKQWPKDKAEKIIKQVVHNKKIIEQEEERLQQEAREAKKRKYAEDAKAAHEAKMKDFSDKLKPEIFDVMRYVVVQKSLAAKFVPRNQHMEEMREYAKKGDWDKVSNIVDKRIGRAAYNNPREFIGDIISFSQRRGLDMEYSGGGQFSSAMGFIKPEDFASNRDSAKSDGEVIAFIIETGKEGVRFVIKEGPKPSLRMFMINSKSYIATRGAIREFCNTHKEVIATGNDEALRKSIDEFLLSR